MAMSSTEKYWTTRRFWEDFYRAKRENKTLDQLKSVFDSAVNEVLEQLEKQADLHKMTAGELLEDFYGRKQKEYYKYINENYEKLMSDDKAYKQFIDEFFPAYDYAKVNRLLEIRSQIFSILAEHGIKADVNGKFSNSLKNEVENTYKSNIQLVNALTGSNQSYKIDSKELERIINYPWSGKSFSTRLWGNVSKLEQDLSGALLESYIQGTGMDGALKSMKAKYDRSFFKNLERLVRTEYNHFGQEAIHESYKARGIKEYEILTAEDERVCIVCGKMHGQTFKEKERSVGKNCAPFHARCRCTDIPKLPDLPDDIDEIYESMFGNLLDDFAKNEFGINPKSLHNRTKSKGTERYANSFGKTNMEKVVGKENYKKFLDSLDLIQDEQIKSVLNWAGGQLEFEKTNQQSKQSGNKIQLSQKAFDGTHNKRPLQTVYHEIGHAIDYLGNELLDEGFSYLSDSTKYQLKNSIKKDFLNLFNKDLEEINGANFKKIKNLKKIDIFDQSALVRKYKKLAEENPYAYTALSDLMESTGGFIEGPLGSGHGLKYWKTSGKQEAEFFAHMTEAFANEDLKLAMYELFPSTTKAWEKMLDEILKKIK